MLNKLPDYEDAYDDGNVDHDDVSPGKDVLLELKAGNEMIIGAIHLLLSPAEMVIMAMTMMRRCCCCHDKKFDGGVDDDVDDDYDDDDDDEVDDDSTWCDLCEESPR